MTENLRLTQTYFGQDAYALLPSLINGRRAYLLGGKTAMEKATPFLPKGLDLCGQAVYGTECTLGNIHAAMDKCTASGAQVVLAMGGGKAIDAGKACATLLKLPVITLPTVAATCAATSALSVVYNEDGTRGDFIDDGTPPMACLIHPTVLAQAPTRFIRAGMGDTLAKYYETTFSARNDTPDNNSQLALRLSPMCMEPIVHHGATAYQFAQQGLPSKEVDAVLKAIIITTGMVSAMIAEAYNGAVAHSLYYAISALAPQEPEWLHGEVVAYGVLVQLFIDGQYDQVKALYPLYTCMGLPTKLSCFHLTPGSEMLERIAALTVTQSDMAHLPYPIIASQLLEAMERLEEWT